jgi:hypothetical protein
MHGVIIGFDIERYSETKRTDEMKSKRKAIGEIVNSATHDISIFAKKEIIDTGDGCFLLIDTSDYENILIGIKRIVENANKDGKIRFRIVIHVGKYFKDSKVLSDEPINPSGFVGEGINIAARYLNASCLKSMLKLNESNCAYGISNDFFNEIYDLDYFEESYFLKYSFNEKDYQNLIYLNIQNMNSLPVEEKILDRSKFIIDDDFQLFLLSSDFVHQNQSGTSNLNTFFIFPEVTSEEPEENSERIISSESIIYRFLKVPFHMIIAGDDQSGKTGLCKKYYSMIYESGMYIPIYIKLQNGEKGYLKNKIEDAINKQYGKKQAGDLENRIIILLIDDFHLIDHAEQKKYIDFIQNQKKTYSILFVDSLFNGSIENKKTTLTYKSYTIRLIGHLLRNRLIEKWIDFTKMENANYSSQDELSEYVNNTFVKGIIPFTPFYILTVLAAKSEFVPLNGELTSKGHCYQALIYIALRKYNIPENEVGAFLNIMSNIAYKFYLEKILSFSEDKLLLFLEEYSEKYNMPFEKEYFIKKTDKLPIFHRNSINQYTFYAPYFFHYFIAKYLADHLSEKTAQQHIADIYNNLDISANAYIGIFIVHHSKNIMLIEEVLINTMVQYDDYNEISLTFDEVNHIEEYASKLNKEVIEEYDNSEEKRRLILLGNDNEKEDTEDTADYSVELKTLIAKLKKAMRTVEVMGHILKNHSGEIEKKHLIECYTNAINVYRRICNMFMEEFKKTEALFIEFIIDRINQNADDILSRAEVSELAHKFFTFYNVSAIYATIKQSANSLGSKGMIKIIKDVTEHMDNPFAYCVYLQCEMWYNKGLPLEESKKKYIILPKAVQFVVQRLIKEYTDLHHISQKDKQQIASAFDMKLQALDYDREK